MNQPFDVRRDPAVWPEKPVIIVSSDSHVAPVPGAYKDYLDPEYRDHFDQYLADIETQYEILDEFGYPFPPDVLEIIDERRALRSGGEMGSYDPIRRLRETEAEGVVAELLHPFSNIAFAPFIDYQQSWSPSELRAAGAKAHNRFLMDFCSAAPGRLLGIPAIYPWPDWAAAIEDMRAARDAGLKAVYPPMMAGKDDDVPAMYDPWWDPFWGACQDLDMVVHIHAGFGHRQGKDSEVEFMEEARAKALNKADGADIRRFDPSLDQQDSHLASVFFGFEERRPLWQLMWGGVFDRFPKLKVAFVEIHCDWVPDILAYLDARHAQGGTPLKLKPSEYWQRNCAVGASLLRTGEVRRRHEIGIDQMMFGTDYPHMESTWPNTHDAIRTTMKGVPEDEARKILGENAIEFYGLDRDLLEEAALRVGPFPSTILGEHDVDPSVVKHLHFRIGINSIDEVDKDELSQVLAEDEQGALAARGAH